MAALRATLRAAAEQYRYHLIQRWPEAHRGQNLRFCLEIAAAIGGRALIIAQVDAVIGLTLFVASGGGAPLAAPGRVGSGCFNLADTSAWRIVDSLGSKEAGK